MGTTHRQKTSEMPEPSTVLGILLRDDLAGMAFPSVNRLPVRHFEEPHAVMSASDERGVILKKQFQDNGPRSTPRISVGSLTGDI
jgi:hypothetical protein